MLLSSGSGFTPTTVTCSIYSHPTFGPLYWIGDFNGDGKADIAGWKSGSGGDYLIVHLSNGDPTNVIFFGFTLAQWNVQNSINNDATYGPRLYLGDFNGDGKTDIAGWVSGDGGASVSMNFSTGSGFAYGDVWPFAGEPLPQNSIKGPVIGDFNGDGKTDLGVWVQGSSGKSLDMYLSKGRHFLQQRMDANFYNGGTAGIKA